MTNDEAADILLGKSGLEQLKASMVKWAEEIILIEMKQSGRVWWDIDKTELSDGQIMKTWTFRAIYREDQPFIKEWDTDPQSERFGLPKKEKS